MVSRRSARPTASRLATSAGLRQACAISRRHAPATWQFVRRTASSVRPRNVAALSASVTSRRPAPERRRAAQRTLPFPLGRSAGLRLLVSAMLPISARALSARARHARRRWPPGVRRAARTARAWAALASRWAAAGREVAVGQGEEEVLEAALAAVPLAEAAPVVAK